MWGVNVVTCKIQALLSMCTVRFFSILGLYISFLCTKTEVEPFCSFVFGFFSFFFFEMFVYAYVVSSSSLSVWYEM